MAQKFGLENETMGAVAGWAVEAQVALGETARAKELLHRYLPLMPPESRGKLLAKAASISWTLGDYDEAVRKADEALSASLDDKDRMKAVGVMLDVKMRRGEPELAVKWAAELRGEFPPDSLAQVSLLMHMARGCEAMGNNAKVKMHLDEALALANKSGDRRTRSQVENQIGIHLFRNGRLDEALEHLSSAESLAKELKMLRLEVQALLNIGNVHTLRGENDIAIECYQRALGMARRGGYRTTEASAEGNIGNILMNQKRHRESQEYFLRALVNFEAMHDVTHTIYTFWSLAESCAYLGERQRGLEYAQRALDMAQKANSKVNEAWSWYIVGLVEGESGEVETARESLKVAVAGYEGLGNPADGAQIHAYWARLEARRGDVLLARSEAEKASRIFQSVQMADKASDVETEVESLLRNRRPIISPSRAGR
jgi:tetratricopeptide (TPR) repeat protein